MEGFGGFFNDPEFQRRMQEMAEQMQSAQSLAWADNAIKLAVDMTVAAINRVNIQGTTEQQALQIRSVMATVFPRSRHARARSAPGPRLLGPVEAFRSDRASTDPWRAPPRPSAYSMRRRGVPPRSISTCSPAGVAPSARATRCEGSLSTSTSRTTASSADASISVRQAATASPRPRAAGSSQ